MKKRSFLLLFLILFAFHGKSQVSVVSIQLQPYNITPDALLSAAIMNGGIEHNVSMVSKLYNFNGELLLSVKSSEFLLKTGLNPSVDLNRKIAAAEYGSDNQSSYIRTTHGLPSGAFRVCIDIIDAQTGEPQDQFCDELESEFNQFLYLVFPADKDTIDSKTPLLLWSHSEPFSVLTQGEYYRMVVSEIKERQGAEEAVGINSPSMQKNYLTVHSLQYPFDAKELEEGKHYAWQVQKLANGVITNKTEAWEFIVRKKPEEVELKYVALKQTIDANFYTAYNGKIYFKFSEEYNSQGGVAAIITADDGKQFQVAISKDEKKPAGENTLNAKVMGDNRFILDLDKEKIKPGFYTMQIRNEKKEIYYLKFYLPK
ncbi:MAG TPA: hypothetical protein VGC65_00075 [Bacteroidia bacterium]|jgi:hypothetical protein